WSVWGERPGTRMDFSRAVKYCDARWLGAAEAGVETARRSGAAAATTAASRISTKEPSRDRRLPERGALLPAGQWCPAALLLFRSPTSQPILPWGFGRPILPDLEGEPQPPGRAAAGSAGVPPACG